MKRKNLIAAIAAALCLCPSCNRLEMPEIYTPATEQEAPSKFVPYQAEYVDVPEGCKSLVIKDGVVVAVCYQSGYVVLPKQVATRAISDYQIVSMPTDASSNVASENELEMVVAFEDTKEGDHDYNDLVFQAHMKISNSTDGTSTVDIDFTPVALGATRTTGLGIVLTDAEGKVIADNVITSNSREFFFEGDTGFVNTLYSRKQYETVSKTITAAGGDAVAGISWYLISRDQKLFASNYFQPCLDESDMPQGLVLMNIRDDVYYVKDGEEKVYGGNDFWQYPTEGASIEDVYSGFSKAFLEGGNFKALATPTGKNFYDAIAAEEDGCLTENSLYEIYQSDEDEEESGEAAEMYYDNTGKACKVPQSFDAIFNTFDHTQDNFILEFSTAKGNAIDFARGDMIEAKITEAKEQVYFNIGNLDVNAEGKAIEGYGNETRTWFRAQDSYSHGTSNVLEKGKSFNAPLIVRISLAYGLEFFIDGKYEQRVDPENSTLASILELGTDTPLYFGLFGNKFETASYEYVKVYRVTKDGPINTDPVDTDIHVKSVSVEDKIILVGEKATLIATVLPENATNKSVTWSSSDESVATVNSATGEVEGIAKGHCTITATSVDNQTITGTCLVTVTTETNEVMIWQDFTTNKETVDSKQFEIIASGTPGDNQICFNNGDYIEAKIHRLELATADKDLFYMTSKVSYNSSNVCLIGHPSKYTEIYVNPAGWWSVASFLKEEITEDFYVRFGCKADMTPGAGSWSNDGINWTTFTTTKGDCDDVWNKLVDPANTPLFIQTARSTGSLQLSKYEYVKIVRAGATVE